jgi:hypothetical protein
MATFILDKIEYLVLLVAAFAVQSKINEAEAYRYLSRYGALAPCRSLTRTLVAPFTSPMTVNRRWRWRSSLKAS